MRTQVTRFQLGQGEAEWLGHPSDLRDVFAPGEVRLVDAVEALAEEVLVELREAAFEPLVTEVEEWWSWGGYGTLDGESVRWLLWLLRFARRLQSAPEEVRDLLDGTCEGFDGWWSREVGSEFYHRALLLRRERGQV